MQRIPRRAGNVPLPCLLYTSITENGGTPQCEEAVVKSLKWLQKQQNKDGSWGGTPQNSKCAMTGLALLYYLAHCETPLSEDFGETVLKGISFLVDQGVKNPVISLVPQRNEVDVYKRQPAWAGGLLSRCPFYCGGGACAC